MTSAELVTYAGYAGMVLASAVACIQQYRMGRANESKRVADAKDELVKSITADRDAWKSRGEATSQEYADYRTATHKASQEGQAKVLTMTEEVARLRAATDITPLLRHAQEQTDINTKILATLDLMQAHLRRITPKPKPRPTKPRK